MSTEIVHNLNNLASPVNVPSDARAFAASQMAASFYFSYPHSEYYVAAYGLYPPYGNTFEMLCTNYAQPQPAPQDYSTSIQSPTQHQGRERDISPDTNRTQRLSFGDTEWQSMTPASPLPASKRGTATPSIGLKGSISTHAKTKPAKGASDLSGRASKGPRSAAPGPIPATTPLVVQIDDDGVQWIAFDYSHERVTRKHTIRCDVGSVDLREIDDLFKSVNCVYPRAYRCKMSGDEYKGNRFVYESECNEIGWALVHLNPHLDGKRGLVQRAVDSWRNSNANPNMRSRRVRRQNKVMSRRDRKDSVIAGQTEQSLLEWHDQACTDGERSSMLASSPCWTPEEQAARQDFTSGFNFYEGR